MQSQFDLDVFSSSSIEDTTEKSTNSEAAKGNYISSRDEMNLAEFPLAILSTRTNPDIKTLEFSDSLTLKNGEIVERKWIITGADKFGLPTSTDDDVLLGLMRLTMDRDFRERKIYFTRYELMKILRWSPEGRSYQRLSKSLDRLSGVRIRASNAFYDNSSKGYQTKNFGIIDAYEINDGRGRKKVSKSGETNSFFIWSEALFDSFKSGFIKKLDLDIYFGLRSAVSRRLYRHLDKHFYYRNTIERPLLPFAFEKVGISRNYKYISSLKQQLEPALCELKSIGFISHYEFRGKGETTSIFCAANSGSSLSKSKLFEKEQSTFNTYSKHESTEEKESSVLRLELYNKLKIQLLERGLNLKQVEKLLLQKSENELIEVQKVVEYYDSLVASSDISTFRNPIGFLYRSVENPTEVLVSVLNKRNRENQSKPIDRDQAAKRRPELKIFKAKAGTAF